MFVCGMRKGFPQISERGRVMRDTYDSALRRILIHEGGYADHPADPGGATMRGVTQRVYDGWRAGAGMARRPVRQIEAGEVQAIYRQLYADKIAYDALPAGVDAVMLDAAVHSGPAQAAKWLQRTIGVTVDGNIGPATVAAAAAAGDPRALVRAIMERRRAFLRALGTFNTFGEGWLRRVADIEAFAMSLISGAARPADPLPQPTGRATMADAAPRPSKKIGDAASGAGFATGAAAGGLAEAKDALKPLAGDGGWIDIAIAGLALAGVALVIGGLWWRWRQRRKAEAQADALDLPAQVAA